MDNPTLPPQQPQPVRLPSPQAAPTPTGDTIGKRIVIAAAIAGGALAIILLCIVALKIYATNTPEYMLAQAFTRLSHTANQAGTITVAAKKQQLQADFVAITDSADSSRRELSLSTKLGGETIQIDIRQLADGSYGRLTNPQLLPVLLAQLRFNKAAAYQTPVAEAALTDADKAWYALSADQMVLEQNQANRSIAQAAAVPSAKDVQNFAALYKQQPFIHIQERLADQTINDVRQVHIKLVIDKEPFIRFLRQAQQAKNVPAILTPELIQTIAASQNDLPSVEVWINTKTHQFTRIDAISRVTTVSVSFGAVPLGHTAVDRPVIVRPYQQTLNDVTNLINLGTTAP